MLFAALGKAEPLNGLAVRGRTYKRTDATNSIISLASRSIITCPSHLIDKLIWMAIPLWIKLTTSWHVIKCHRVKEIRYGRFCDYWAFCCAACTIFSDMSWQNMSFIMIYHDISCQIMKWLHLTQRGYKTSCTLNLLVIDFCCILTAEIKQFNQ